MSSQDYAEMIEIPVNSCRVLNEKPAERKTPKRLKLTGDRFLSIFKKRKSTKNTIAEEDKEVKEDNFTQIAQSETVDNSDDFDNALKEKVKSDKKIKFDIISFQVAVIFVLAVGILLTCVFWKDSGINNLFKTVFAIETETADERNYDAFQAFAPAKSLEEIKDGVMTVGKGGAVYSPSEGVVESVKSGEKFTIVVSHSKNYKTVIVGVDYSYVKEGDKVFTSAPIGYSKEGGTEVTMYDGETLIKNYAVEDGKIVWQK